MEGFINIESNLTINFKQWIEDWRYNYKSIYENHDCTIQEVINT